MNNKEKRKVLFITSTFPDENESVLAKWIGQLARNIKDEGYDLTVFAPASCGRASHEYYGITVNRFRYAPSKVEILTQEEGAVFKLKKNPLLSLLLPSFFLCGIVNLIVHLTDDKYDVVHVHWPFPMAIFGIVVKIINPNTRLIYTFYGAEFALVRKVPFGKKLLALLIKKADKVTSISNYTKKLVTDIYRMPITIIPFTTGFSVKLKAAPKLDFHKKMNIIFVGRLIERKGVEYLIQASDLLKDRLDLEVNIVGSGVLIDDLKNLVKTKKLKSIVTFHGRVSDKKLVALYQKSDVFVLPSIHDKWGDTEGLGVVLLEAMSFKKPVIASRVGGITDIIKHNKTGLLVPEKDPQKLAEAIYSLLSNKSLYNKLSKGGFDYLNSMFSWKSIIDKTKRVYNYSRKPHLLAVDELNNTNQLQTKRRITRVVPVVVHNNRHISSHEDESKADTVNSFQDKEGDDG